MTRPRLTCKRCGGPVTKGSRTGICKACYTVLRAEHATRGKPQGKAGQLTREAIAGLIAGHWHNATHDYRTERQTYGDSVVISDVHAPFHDGQLLLRCMKVGKLLGLKRLVIAGDLIDFAEISRYAKQGGNKAVSAAQSIRIAIKILTNLSGWFDEIIVLKGNHDARLQALIESAAKNRTQAQQILTSLAQDEVEQHEYRYRYILILNSWLEHEAPALTNIVTFLPHPVCFIAGPTPAVEPWRVTHPRAYSRHAPTVEKKLSIKFDQPVLGTHGHIMGLSIAPNGKYPVCQFGCMTRSEQHLYLFENETDHPKWVRGFAAIVSGRLRLFTDNDYLTDWTPIDEVTL